MRLSRVRIRNYRSIEDVEVSFDPSCRVLVGINESGKSNILRALSLLSPEQTVTSSDVREFPPNEDPNSEAFVHFVFTIEKSARIAVLEKLLATTLAKDLAQPIIFMAGRSLTLAEFVDSQEEVVFIVNVRTGKKVWGGWRFPDKTSVAPGWYKPSAAGQVATLTSEDDFDVELGDYKIVQADAHPDIAKNHIVDLSLTDLRALVIDKLNEEVAGQRPGCVFWAYDDNNLLPGQIDLDDFAADPDICVPLKHMFQLAGYSAIATTLSDAQKRPNGLRNVLKRVATVATEHMHSVWSEYKGIRIELYQNGSNIDAGIEDAYNLYDLSRRSDGFKRFVSFLMTVSTQVRTNELSNVLYLHDEPDSSLHPSGARYLRDELIKISENNYVVYSTHSIFMIDREIIERHLIVRKESEITSVDQVDASNIVDEEVIYNALGYSVFEELKPLNLVFEGWRDKRMFQVARTRVPSKFKKVKEVLGSVGICHAKGVKDIGRVTPMLELANRGCVIISDSDQVAVQHQRDYKGYGAWYRYDELVSDGNPLTGEDFVKPEALAQAMERVKSEHPNLSDVPLTELKVEHGRVDVIRRWLQQGGLDKAAVASELNEIKESVFNNLRPNQIEDSYYELLSELAARVK